MRNHKEAIPRDWSHLVDLVRYVEENGYQLDPELLPTLPDHLKQALGKIRSKALAQALAVLKKQTRDGGQQSP
jgi:hypothetical protein